MGGEECQRKCVGSKFVQDSLSIPPVSERNRGGSKRTYTSNCHSILWIMSTEYMDDILETKLT